MPWSLSTDVIATKLGLEEDKIRFIFCLVLCLPLGHVFRTLFSVHRVSSTTRHLTSIALGLWISWFCCGWYILHLLLVSSLCYGSMLVVHPSHVSWFVMLLSFFCLGYVHMQRVLASPEDYTIDISGRLMLIIQKVTFVAWNISDSYTLTSQNVNGKNDVKEKRKRLAPSPLEYFSYVFHFVSLLVGPVVSYADYIDYIEGNDMRTLCKGDSNQSPSPYRTTVKSLAAAIFCAVFFVVGRMYFKLEELADPQFVGRMGWIQLALFLALSHMIIRYRYFFAWKMGEASTSLSGLGFTGYDAAGDPTWDNSKCVNIVSFETNSDILHRPRNWNISTHLWLKKCVYRRLPFCRTELTYLINGIWHGFYPGYFVCVLSVIPLYKANEMIQRKIMPCVGQCVGVVQFVVAVFFVVYNYLMLCYVTVPFILLTFDKSITFYRNLNFCGHLLVMLLMAVAYALPDVKREKATTNGVVDPPASKFASVNSHCDETRKSL